MTYTGTRSSKGATFLFLLGLALVGAGAAFAYAPKYSWQVAKIAEQASAYGVQNGALVVGGLVVLGLAIVARSAGGSAPSSDTKEELEGMQAAIHLLSEQLSTKVGQLRTALLQVQESVASVAAQQIVPTNDERIGGAEQPEREQRAGEPGRAAARRRHDPLADDRGRDADQRQDRDQAAE